MIKQDVLSPSTSTIPSISLEKLFETKRFQANFQLFKVVLYFPFALLLLVIRIIIGCFGFLVLSFLPRKSQKRVAILKGISKVFGLIVEVDDKYIDENVKLLVANHVSVLDRLAVNFMVPCCTIATDFQVKNIDCLSFWKDTDLQYPKDLSEEVKSELQKYIEDSPIRLLHFPECGTTNGKVGLLKFHPALFSLNVAIQPILIHVSLSSFMTLSPSILNSTPWVDGLWHFVSPSSFYKLKILPSMVKLPEETVSDFSKRVQKVMAFALNIAPTIHTSSDKAELEKRLKGPSTVTAHVRVPPAKKNAFSPKLTPSNKGKSMHLPSVPLQKLSMNTAAENFGRTPSERMASYQERRALLLQAARQKYLEKRSS